MVIYLRVVGEFRAKRYWDGRFCVWIVNIGLCYCSFNTIPSSFVTLTNWMRSPIVTNSVRNKMLSLTWEKGKNQQKHLIYEIEWPSSVSKHFSFSKKWNEKVTLKVANGMHSIIIQWHSLSPSYFIHLSVVTDNHFQC